jgi:thioredoxin
MIKILMIIGTIVVGAIIGGIIGYYGKCNTGQCPLTSTPWGGAIWGALLASIIALTLFNKPPKVPDSPSIVKITSATEFATLLSESQQPILVDFYADWCGPCRNLSPLINKLSEEFSGQAKIIKINIDNASELARKYQVSSIPCVIVFNKGKETDRFVGVRLYQDYSNALKKLIETEKKP